MRQVTGSMANVVKGMDSAMKSMDLEKVRCLYLMRFAVSTRVKDTDSMRHRYRL